VQAHILVSLQVTLGHLHKCHADRQLQVWLQHLRADTPAQGCHVCSLGIAWLQVLAAGRRNQVDQRGSPELTSCICCLIQTQQLNELVQGRLWGGGGGPDGEQVPGSKGHAEQLVV
jgi:hypothetical protein